jgi:multiple sugar transport system permease protein
MTRLSRWRTAAFAALAAGALLPAILVQGARARYQRMLGERDATAAAAYLALVTPAARTGVWVGGGGGYDLPQLLIRARALDGLPGLGSSFEIYNRTAPLVEATAPPLPPGVLERLRREGAVHWTGGATLVPLTDRAGWDVVGGVAARPRPRGWPLGPWSLAALLLFLVAGTQAVRAIGGPREPWRQALARASAAAALFGFGAFADVQVAARGATDRWLSDTRRLMQEATARIPDARIAPGILAPIAHDAELVPGDSSDEPVSRADVGGLRLAIAAVRLGPGRWVELRTRPLEAGTEPWVAVTLGPAALGVAGLWFAAWSIAAAPRRRRETLAAWGFLAPSTLHLVAFSLGPLLVALYLSLHRASPVESTDPFVGLANYERTLRDSTVWRALGHTLVYALYVPISTAAALGVALLLAGRSRTVGIVRTLFFLPCVASLVPIALLWRWMYHPTLGVINHALARAGLGPVDWLGDPRTALVALMIVSAWATVGGQMTVFLAGLATIPRAYLDAARVDGANAWQRFWRVTFPLLRPVTVFVLVTGIIGACQVFALVVVLTGGGPLGATDVVVSRLVQTGWEQWELGDASALGLLLFAVLFGAIWAQFRLLARQAEHA